MACRGRMRSFAWLADSLWTWYFFLIQSYCIQLFHIPLLQGQVSVFEAGTIYWTTSISSFPNSIRFLSKTVHNRISGVLLKSVLFFPCFLICISRHTNKRNVYGVAVKTFHRLGSHPARKMSCVGSLVMDRACSFKTEKAATVHQQVSWWKYVGRTNFSWTVNNEYVCIDQGFWIISKSNNWHYAMRVM